MIAACRTRFPELPLERACTLLGVNRGSFYRAVASTGPEPTGTAPTGEPEALALRAAIEGVVLAFPGYGYRRVTHHLQREGWRVNHKRVLRVMQQESLLCQIRRRWVKTTDSEHGLRVYPNLLREGRPTGLDAVWVADITYIRLREQFVYLATLMDAFSRRVVGWCLSQEIDRQLVLTALERSLARRQPPLAWIHHSDQGVQYVCGAYTERLLAAGAQISMAAKGTPLENAQAERFFRTLKQEEVYLHDYQSFMEAEASIGCFIDEVYNQKRLHSALGYRPPCEFEKLFLNGTL
ncbi:MAG TPA: IS3 family transposase [Terriglobales bacterium]|nr:IS3 family transposase [Terriglobales bacterium]